MPRGESIRAYTPEEDELIFENFHDAKKRAELPELLGRTAGGIQFHFYKSILPARGLTSKEYMRLHGGKGRQRRPAVELERVTIEEPPPVEVREEPILPVIHDEPLEELLETKRPQRDDSFLESLHAFPEQQSELLARMTALEERMHALQGDVGFYLNEFSTGVVTIADRMQNREQALAEYKRLQKENGELRDKIKELQESLDWQNSEYRKIYGQLDFWLGRFMQLSSVDKIASLADFLPKLKYTYDQFGTIIKVASEMS